MTRFGFHASHEQVAPGQLLTHVRAAERFGFGSAMCSDHFTPWSRAQGESGFAWTWLGAALASTEMSYGVVTAPGQRYHPAVHAQMIATVAEMFPGRFWVALGSGQAMNEHVTGGPWPAKRVREERLLECVEITRALLAGHEVTHRGLITVNQPVDVLREVIDAYRGNGGTGPLRLQVHVSWAPTDEEALTLAHEQWAPALLGSPVGWELATPEEFEQAAAFVRRDDVHPGVLASSDPARHVAWLTSLADLGFDDVLVHHVGKDQAGFLATYGEHVLPALRAVAGVRDP